MSCSLPYGEILYVDIHKFLTRSEASLTVVDNVMLKY